MKVASAIMTTDTRPKVAFIEIKLGDKKVRIAGIAKRFRYGSSKFSNYVFIHIYWCGYSSVTLNKYLNKVLAKHVQRYYNW